jgi:O-antigen/teichoic acid export membrane protein
MSNPATSVLSRARDTAHQRSILLKTCLVVFSAGAANFCVWFFFSDPLVVWIFGEKWREAIPVFHALAGLSIAYAIMYIPSTFLTAAKRFRTVGTVRFIGVLIFLSVLFAFQSTLRLEMVCYLLQTLFIGTGLVNACYASSLLRRNDPGNQQP